MEVVINIFSFCEVFYMDKDNSKSKIRLLKPKTRVFDVVGFVDHVVRWKLDGMMPTAFRGQRYFDWTAKAKIFRPT